MNRLKLFAAVIMTTICAGCGGSPSAPSSHAIVTFTVIDQRFRVLLTNREQIDAARAAQAGGPARIPNGRVVNGTQVNTGWTWHLEDVEFAENSIELCDGRPADVERDGPGFGGGRYCPWAADIVAIDVLVN